METPILNIDNPQLVEQCYFMDIPGLNEDMASYIEIIFSIITLDNIIFEIMVFDSTNIGSGSILGIFKELEKKNSLKKSGNIFILNKIDQCTKNGEGEIIDSFKKYFYEKFEDEKREENGNIFINIYQNYIIPMNSILYLAETKINDDFCRSLKFPIRITFARYKIISWRLNNFSVFTTLRSRAQFAFPFLQPNVVGRTTKLQAVKKAQIM